MVLHCGKLKGLRLAHPIWRGDQRTGGLVRKGTLHAAPRGHQPSSVPWGAPTPYFFDVRNRLANPDDLGGGRVNELWSDDFEVLHWVVERFERTGHSIEVGEALRVFPEEQYDSVRNSLVRLSSHTYMVTVNGGGRGGVVKTGSPAVNEATDRALRLAETLSDNPELLADRILAVLAEGVVSEADPQKRYKLEAGLRGVGGMTRDVFVDVIAAAVARSTALTRGWTRPYDPASQDQPQHLGQPVTGAHAAVSDDTDGTDLWSPNDVSGESVSKGQRIAEKRVNWGHR